jgi:antitoxin ParD1/3/4
MARDRAVDKWLMQEVGPAYDALKENPARAVMVDQLRATLEAEHKKAWFASNYFGRRSV